MPTSRDDDSLTDAAPTDAPRVADMERAEADGGAHMGFGSKFWAMNRQRVIDAERSNDSYSLFEGTPWAAPATPSAESSSDEDAERTPEP